MTKPLRTLFAEVAPTYERVNRVLTLGLDVRWRNAAARLAASGGGRRWLDVCSGTGEMAAALARHAAEDTEVIALDFCRPMLARAAAKREPRPIAFALGDVRAVFHLYIKLAVRRVGTRLSGSRAGYAYLSATIPKFYPADELEQILCDAGFDEVLVRRLFLGVAAIHIARAGA